MIVAEFIIVAVLLAGGAYVVSVLIALFTDCTVEEDTKYLQMEEVKASVTGKQANWAWMTRRWKYTEFVFLKMTLYKLPLGFNYDWVVSLTFITSTSSHGKLCLPQKAFHFLCSLKTIQGVLRKAIKLTTEIRAPIRVCKEWMKIFFLDSRRMIIFLKSRHVSWLSIINIWTFCFPKTNERSLITLSSWRWTMRRTGKAPSHRLSPAFISPSPQPPPYNKRRLLLRSLQRQPHASCYSYFIFFFQDELLRYRDVE